MKLIKTIDLANMKVSIRSAEDEPGNNAAILGVHNAQRTWREESGVTDNGRPRSDFGTRDDDAFTRTARLLSQLRMNSK